MRVGDIRIWDHQSDVFGGRYKLIEQLDRGEWLAETLEPTDAEMVEIEAAYLEHGMYTDYHDPFGPERRMRTPEEAAEAEILARIDRTGEQFKIKFVSSAQWDAMF